MKYKDFVIGKCFYTATGKWLCTDIGTRTVIAIKSTKDKDWMNGPPYAVVEEVFNEYDFGGCRKTK